MTARSSRAAARAPEVQRPKLVEPEAAHDARIFEGPDGVLRYDPAQFERLGLAIVRPDELGPTPVDRMTLDAMRARIAARDKGARKWGPRHGR
jgi:hypothetical protein